MNQKEQFYQEYKQYQKQIGLDYNKQDSVYHITVPKNKIIDTMDKISGVVAARQFYSEEYCNNQIDYGHQKQIDALLYTQIHPLNKNGTYDMRFTSNKQFKQ